jgi:hypothetical protein
MDEVQNESKIDEVQPEVEAKQQPTVTGEFVQTEIVKLTVVKEMN